MAVAFSVGTAWSAEIKIQRAKTGEKATVGILYVDGKRICETFELPNRTPYKWIASGKTHDAYIRTDGKRGWRIELKDTAPLEHVQIHTGNVQEQTEGCTLVGYKADANKGISDSINAREALKKAVEASASKKITVEFTQEP